MAELLTIDEALAAVLARVRPLPAEAVVLRHALGRVLAADARANADLPPFDSSAMDGFAVRAADTPGRLRVVAQSAAGRPADVPVEPNTTIAISTGAVVPVGADAVVPIEHVAELDDAIETPAVVVGANVRRRGGDVRAGVCVVAAGVRLRPTDLGALGAAGVPEVECGRRPRVAVLPTGTELRPPGDPLEEGQIYESNSILLAAAARSAGADVDVLPPATDDAAETREALRHGLDADVLLTSGGVSVGTHDLVRGSLAELGATEHFWGVAVRPGKPLAFATRGDTLVFGLPGNPVSSLVGFELFVRPALLALQGAAEPGPRYLPGRLASPWRPNPARDELVRARQGVEDGAVVLSPLSGQESHLIVTASSAEALVLVPRGDADLAAGTPVKYLSL